MDPTAVLALRTEQTTRLMNAGSLPLIRDRFQGGYCRENTNLLDHKAAAFRRLTADGATRDVLLDRDVFLPGAFSAEQNWALYWAVEQSVAEVSMMCAVKGLNEEFQTSAFFGALRANLSVFAALDPELESEGTFSFYFADCKSEATETSLGADFALVFPLDVDRYKVALFQAKIVNDEGLANVYRYNKRHETYQLDRLVATNQQFQQLDPPRKIRGQCCYYAFWDRVRPGAMLRPTIRTVEQVRNDVAAGKQRHNWTSGDSSKVWAVSPFKRATYFSEFVGLLLPADNTFAGSAVTGEELWGLLAKPDTRPKHVLGIASGKTGFSLEHWLELDAMIGARTQIFSAGGRTFDLDQMAPKGSDAGSRYDPSRF